MPKPTQVFIGQRYGGRVVTGIEGRNERGQLLYKFRCDCGYIGIARSAKILNNPLSCEHCRKTKAIDMVGKTTKKWRVVSEAGKNKHGAMYFNCICVTCGAEHKWTGYQLRKADEPICKICRPPYEPKPRTDIVGQVINGWQVLEQYGTNKHGAILFRCIHLDCGNESLKTCHFICNYKVGYCHNCPPSYTFINEGAFTSGTLTDGTRFLIDTDMVDAFEKKYWHKDSKGYIISTQSDQPKELLHRFVLGLDGNIIIDHINRDKTDNRRENLRIVTAEQNAFNKNMLSTNTTGYVGVCKLKKKNKYFASIGRYNRKLSLGNYSDIKEAAAAYNIAAAFLFGEYAGHMNDVPIPSARFAAAIEEKCIRFQQKYGGEPVG
jgi:hypothetical protein